MKPEVRTKFVAAFGVDPLLVVLVTSDKNPFFIDLTFRDMNGKELQRSLLFQSRFLLVVGLAMLGGFVVLCKVYFFSAPLTGSSISLACYVASIVLSRVAVRS